MPAVALAVGLGVMLAAQDPPPRIRSGVDVLTADVQVVDNRGRPVLDLTPADFEVFVGGRRRDVVSADLIRYGSETQARSGGAGHAADAPGEELRPRRMYVIAVDEPSIRFGAARAAMEAARRFIRRLEPGDLVGLFAYPTGTARVDLTTEHGDVLAALDRVTAMFDPPRTRYNISMAEALDIASRSGETYGQVTKRECGGNPGCPREIQTEAQSIAITLEMTVSRSLAGLEGLIDGLAAIPGRKILVLVSGGLPLTDRGMGRGDESGRMAAVGALAARADTTLYALHMDTRFLDAFGERQMTNTLMRDESIFATGLERLADAAGGTVFRLQTGSADPAFDRLLVETSAHYLLGVAVADDDRDGRTRPIRVVVKRRGLTVRSRATVMIPAR